MPVDLPSPIRWKRGERYPLKAFDYVEVRQMLEEAASRPSRRSRPRVGSGDYSVEVEGRTLFVVVPPWMRVVVSCDVAGEHAEFKRATTSAIRDACPTAEQVGRVGGESSTAEPQDSVAVDEVHPP